MTIARRTLRIGVDVGGTNTDAVILDITPGANVSVVTSHKALTSADVTTGIQNAISGCLKKASVQREHIQAVAIGTTSFVNSLIERDSRALEKVGVIRLCGAHSRLTPPFVSFPNALRHVLEGPAWTVQGGLQVDGRQIDPIKPEEILGICAELKRQSIRTVAVSGIYSPIDHEFRQEETVRDILKAEIPDIKVTISKDVANIGLLERENATILNASLLTFARKAVAGFKDSLQSLNLNVPLFLTSNDGTLMSCDQAEHFPIKTFSSGPTNSMRGANFLASLASGGPRKETALVIDVGGTTTEIGVLLPTGFPRQAGARHELCGVPLNFSMPHVHSIGLGGGSRVREEEGKITVGPDSVGYRIDKEAFVFGGNTLTATDITVASGIIEIGDTSLVKKISPELVEAAQRRMKRMLELAIESMKTSVQAIPVYVVGGGAILVPDTLEGISKVHRFPYYDAANAVGAACAEVCGIVDTFEETTSNSLHAVQKKVEERAIRKAIAAGSDPRNTTVVESEIIPIAYTAGRARFYVKAPGPWTGSAVTVNQHVEDEEIHKQAPIASNSSVDSMPANVQPVSPFAKDIQVTAQTILDYKPTVNKDGEWILSEFDVEWMAVGCYILGTGGGGSAFPLGLALKKLIREGAIIKVIDLESMEEDGKCIWGGNVGSPEVSEERLISEEYNMAVIELMDYCRMSRVAGLAALEIGGANGMLSLLAGASTYLDTPTIDGDFMGRAYPTSWQTTPNVFDFTGRGEILLPSTVSTVDGNSSIMTRAKDDKEIDAVQRAACVEMGTWAGSAQRPLTKPECQQAMIRNTLSQAWRIGRAVNLANKQSDIGNIGQILVDACGGDSCARIVWSGKIVDVTRSIHKGHSYGNVVIKPLQADEEEDEKAGNSAKFQGLMTIPFKNENLMCKHSHNGTEKVVVGVPDLISVIDAQNGNALGTQEYRYGLRVLVLAVTAAPQWTDTPRGLKVGGLGAFGYEGIPYEPVGKYVKPKSVIEEYRP